MELDNSKEQLDREWVEESLKDPWFSTYRSAFDRWEHYKKVDPDRAEKEYQSMLVAMSKGTWWKKWN